MNGSIYDNVPYGIKQTAALQTPQLANADVTAAGASPLQLSRKDSNGFCIESFLIG